MSFLLGGVGDLLGRRKLLVVSCLGSIPLFMIFYAPKAQNLVLASAALYSLLHNAAVISAVSLALEDRSSVGRRFSALGIAASLGWFSGSTIAWPSLMALGNVLFAVLVSVIYLAGLCFLWVDYPKRGKTPYGYSSNEIIKPVATAVREMGRILPALVFTGSLTIIGTNYCAVLLDAKVQELTEHLSDRGAPRTLYGLFYGGIPTLLGVPARLIAARVVDKGLHYEAFIASVLAYLALYSLLPFTSPLLFVILWQIPVYPFYDTSIFAIASRRTSGFESSVTGLILSAMSISGLTVLCVTSVLGDLSLGLYLLYVQAFASMAIVLTVTAYLRQRTL